MRFRKSVKICKGVRVNFSKSGISTTVGMRGLSVNIGKKGTYLNTGIPGTGLYDRYKISGGSTSNSKVPRTTSNSSTQTISTRIDLNFIMLYILWLIVIRCQISAFRIQSSDFR